MVSLWRVYAVLIGKTGLVGNKLASKANSEWKVDRLLRADYWETSAVSDAGVAVSFKFSIIFIISTSFPCRANSSCWLLTFQHAHRQNWRTLEVLFGATCLLHGLFCEDAKCQALLVHLCHTCGEAGIRKNTSAYMIPAGGHVRGFDSHVQSRSSLSSPFNTALPPPQVLFLRGLLVCDLQHTARPDDWSDCCRLRDRFSPETY